MKIYTKGGDKGRTSLAGGERVAKFDKRVEAYGTIDELMAHMALFADKMRTEESLAIHVKDIDRINSQLMTIGSHFATGEGSKYQPPKIAPSATEYLEQRIDEMIAPLPKIFQFTIPGGLELTSMSHICRTVARRAERRAIEAAEDHPIDSEALRYINRLSDYLYALGRTLNIHFGVEDILWQKE
ncbi:MAG: cob(I)yrinic acid a,c-diamide adenosyltransferase [Rikenellaceae bacterium]